MWLRQVGVRKASRGVKTMKKLFGCVSMVALVVLLAAPVSAQELSLRVSVPFLSRHRCSQQNHQRYH